MLRTKPIAGKLKELQDEIQGYADYFGLDYFPQIFEMCDYDTINILAAQGGFPSRYPHWKFGMDYDQMSKGYRFGLQKIYEMVINSNPCYAYLLEVNNWVDQKLVMAHVYGHNDFFKNNMWFSGTNRGMMDVMANHSTKVRRYIAKYGQDRVETFIDRILSIDNLLDVNVLFETPELQRQRRDQIKNEKEERDELEGASRPLKTFMGSKLKESVLTEKTEQKKGKDLNVSKLKGPARDIIYFLMQNAPLEEWEVDVLGILREEAYYFLPQRMTKIMNEGWASYWHSSIMTQKALGPNEFVDFADKHAGVMVMSKQNINPYKVGIELFRDIEFRWNTGRFGKDYNECPSMHDMENWDTNLMQGREKIFELRKTHNDITFIDEFLTPEFCQRQQIFTYKYNPRTGRNEIDTRDFEAIKSKLLTQLTNFGSPIIEVIDDNYMNRSELLLNHIHGGVDLDMQFATETLKNVFFLWKRPVNLKTMYDDKEVVFHFDGKEFKPVHS